MYINLVVSVAFLKYVLYTRYTMNGNKVYAFSFTWPESGVLLLGSPIPHAHFPSIDLIGGGSHLTWKPTEPAGVGIIMPYVDPATIKAKWVYVFRLIGFE